MSRQQVTTALAERWRADAGDYPAGIAWAPGGALVAVAAAPGPVLLLDGATGEPVGTPAGHADGASCVAWSDDPAGLLLASGGHDGAVRLWRPGGDLVAELVAGAPWVEQVAWSEDGQLLATAAGKIVRVWTREGVLAAELPRQASTVTAIGWRPGKLALPKLATACYGGARLWRIGGGAARAAGGAGTACGQVEEPPQVAAAEWKGSVLAASWSPDGRRVATGAQDGLIHIWHPENDDKLEMGPYPSKVRTMAWSASAGMLVTIAGDLLVLWSFTGAGPAGKKPVMLKGHEEEVLAVAAQARGPLLASGDADGVVAVWSPQGRRRPLTTVDLGDAVERLAWSPGDRVLLAACAGGEVVALELE